MDVGSSERSKKQLGIKTTTRKVGAGRGLGPYASRMACKTRPNVDDHLPSSSRKSILLHFRISWL
jgi:hypothetical protein